MRALRDALTAAVLAILLFAPVFAVCFLNCGNIICDFDVWWHLQTAKWIVANSAVPQVDVFSAPGERALVGGKDSVSRADSAGKDEAARAERRTPWVDYSWAAQLVLGAFHKFLGLRGLIVYTALFTFAIILAFHALVRCMQKNLVVGAVLTFAAGVGMLPDATPRPWLFSMLFFVIELYLLLEAGRAAQPRLLLLLVPLFWIWANVHIQFVLGLVVLGAALVEPLLARRLPLVLDDESSAMPAHWLLLVFSLCCGATLLNPYHVRLYGTALQLLGETELRNFISEVEAMRFRSLRDWVVLGAALAGVWAIASRRPVRLLLVLLFPLALYCSFRSRRDGWIVLIVGLSLVASASRGFSLAPARLSPRVRFGAAAVLTALILGSCSSLNEVWLGRQVARRFPVQAVAFLRQGSYKGPLYNTFEWGGFLIRHFPEHAVCIDGRTLVYGTSRVVHSIRMQRGEEGWQSDPELSAARLLVLPRGEALTLLVRLDTRFHVVYEDRVAVVFVRP